MLLVSGNSYGNLYITDDATSYKLQVVCCKEAQKVSGRLSGKIGKQSEEEEEEERYVHVESF